ncbi:MAG TPA: PAS domain S-box protein [Candidatus Nitrosotalea sp.]|nr:PAS domain S-box protein [Candidatus Nitrosotalea sp.]
MNRPIRILQVGDDPADTEQVTAQFRKEETDFELRRVATNREFASALQSAPFDVVIADYKLTSFDSLKALDLLRERPAPEPFILFTDGIGEELVAECFRHGVSDCVFKNHAERLVPAVRNVLREVEERTRRRESETALQSREKLFQALTHHAQDLVTILDHRGVIKYQSASSERVLGHQPAELLGRSVFELVHREDLPGARAAFERGIQNPGSTVTLDLRIRHHDGSWRYLEASGQNMLDDPDINGVVVNSRDITERKLTEEKLRQNEERFRRITENMADLVAVLDVQGRRLYNSPSYRNLLGDPDHLKGTQSFEEIHPDDRDRIRRVFRETLVTGIGQRAEYRFLRSDGTIRYIESQGSVVRDHEGKVVNIIVVSRDITERKNAEAQIREQAALLDKAQDAICVTDLDQRIGYWNKSAEVLYGWTSEEVVGKNASELLFKANASQAMEALKSLIAKREWKGELRQVTRSGADLIVESRWTLIHDTDGKPKSILVINTDITEKKKLETQFFRSQRLENIGMLSSGIAHDLNNVLAPIMMAVPMLRERIADPRLGRFLDTLEKSAQRGAELVSQILSFARGAESTSKLLHLRHLIGDIENIIRETFPKTIEFRKRIAPDLAAIRGNTTQIHQVLLNLCVNARDAMPDGGVLSISAENGRTDEAQARHHPDSKPGRCVVVSVADTGTGIPPEILESIFDPFFTTKEPGMGTGLGLATVTGILKNHHGFVEVESAVGQGTRFKIFLPAADFGAPSAEEVKTSELPTGNGELILVVDDEVAIREIAKATLENYGYRVLTADSGAEAVALFRQNERDVKVVVLDGIMPFMDGPSTARALREVSPSVRIVAVSGLGSEGETAATSAGDKAFLIKPYTAGQLLAAIRRALNAPG